MSWSDLPAELVAGIADRITEHADLARFRSVCPSWRSASAEHAARRRVPLLLLPSQQNSRVNRRLWSLADDSITEIPMPAACGRSFLFASPRGWTLAVADDFSATLLHPFTGASESLPALPPSFHDGYQMILRDMVWDRSPDAVMVSQGCHRSKGLFKAFRADRGNLAAGWSEVGGGGLGDRAVFVDHVRGFCVEANGVNGVRRNCVYVASAHEEANANSGWGDWGRYTVSMLDLDGLTTSQNGNLLKCLHGHAQRYRLDGCLSSPRRLGWSSIAVRAACRLKGGLQRRPSPSCQKWSEAKKEERKLKEAWG
ncbi:unnamed protein product [Triticum turgidum subsp. durum]|uniref:KIB1-4 beta-propeller domain-containing protein n=1 Tax=Triticum turgidum subsp. durum TaxID=4567 RepID=A0A9R0QEK9_TRITD|nr:unnamed protein product [Triticum turgidum subsp. durum]